MLPEEVIDVLEKTEFVMMATASLSGRPNAAPKFLLKQEGDHLYFVDYVMNRMWKDLKRNNKVSIAIMDMKGLVGYQINGRNRIIARGKEFDELVAILKKKLTKLSAKRIIDALHSGVRSENYEMSIPSDVVFFKVKVTEVAVISSRGDVARKNMAKGTVRVKSRLKNKKGPLRQIQIPAPQE